jgi:quinol monooxygenase YgiN
VAAQVALPDWVRARGLGLFLMVMFGGLSLGSALWGGLASQTSIPLALVTAAGLALVGIRLTRGAELRDTDACDLAPVENWPAPMVDGEIPQDKGPVMVTVEYRIAAADRAAFMAAMRPVARARQRLGAFGWELFEDAAQAGRFVETFVEASWADHLRHHARTSAADREVNAAARRYHQRPAPPTVTHLIPPRLPGEGRAVAEGSPDGAADEGRA